MSVSILPAATLSGLVKDTKTNKPLSFANVALYEKDSEKIKTGTMSGVDGTFRIFNIPAGNYYLVITYMGYEKRQVNDISLNGKKIDIGTILMSPAAIEMDNVTVEAEKPAIRYEIDKQVIDARQFITAGGSAVDILENVPSVTVDVEGNVSLNNRRDITVMIDGRPSILDPQDALKIIPSETIENIEIMTNPSVKFEAEGGAGIINIVTKRDKAIGLTGYTTFRVGTLGLSGTALMNYSNKKISAYVSFNGNSTNYCTESYIDRYLYLPDTTVNQRLEGISDGRSKFGGIKGGLDWNISKNDVFGVIANYYPRSTTRSIIKDYTVSNLDPITSTVFNTNDYISYENFGSDEMRLKIAMDYKHSFPKKTKENSSDPTGKESAASLQKSKSYSSNKHQLTLAASYADLDSDNESSTYLVNIYGDTTEGQWTSKIGPTSSLRGKLEYTRPINNTSHIETGAIANFNWKTNGNNVYYYDPLTESFDLQDLFSNFTDYKQNTFSAYALYRAKFGQLGFQPGIRAEYTYREISSDAIDSIYVIDDLNIFPSLHLSYELPSNIQLMGSYTRRITRPPGYKLEPFYTWKDAYNISIGNPALKPQMTDVYSLNASKNFGKNTISLNTYYSQTKDKTETIRTIYQEDDNVIQSTYENVGKDQSLGLSLSSNLSLLSWWRLNISGSLYYYQIDGELYGETISKESTSYSTYIMSSFNFPTKTRLQLSVIYLPIMTTVQGSSSGLLISNLGLNQDFFKGKLSTSLSINNIFGKNLTKSEIYTPTTYIYSEYYRDAPTISLNLSLKINNYKKQRSVSSIESDGFDSESSDEF
jgi:outer membrane receptor protein involved in Fe transport